LIVHPDGAFTGTIGGGALEWKAIAIAQAALANPAAPRAEKRSFALGPELGQCCGGNVDLLVELVGTGDKAVVADLAAREAAGAFTTRGTLSAQGVVRRVDPDISLPPGIARLDGELFTEGFGDDRRAVVLFGAGHVGRALVLALAPLPFTVTWIDPRPDAFPAYLPANVTARRLEHPPGALDEAVAGSFVLVMSHSHPLDLSLVHAALSGDRFPYVGLIGSKSKRMRFEKRLAAAGIPRERSASLVCPIGVAGIRSKVPAVIAAATAAELLVRDEALRMVAMPGDLSRAPLIRSHQRG
jgi:xanthine dehydrogenase accessory factor